MLSNKIIYLDDLKHEVRVVKISERIARALGYSDLELKDLTLAALFHDVGKAYIDHKILNKKDKLRDEERRIIQEHVIYSAKEVLNMGYSNKISEIIKCHHENFNGTGYPRGLKGEEIPISSRIIKISDVFDALTSDRVYREKMNRETALKTMIFEKENFDPKIFEIFMSYEKEQSLVQEL